MISALVRILADIRFWFWCHGVAEQLRTYDWAPEIAWAYASSMRVYFDNGTSPADALNADRQIWGYPS